jgi:hypothetical protein
MTADEARALAFSFPGVEEMVSAGSTCFKANGKVLARFGSRVSPDDLQLPGVGYDEAEFLMAAEPEVFHTTPHYSGANHILARMPLLDPQRLRALLERRWRAIALHRLVRAYDRREVEGP